MFGRYKCQKIFSNDANIGINPQLSGTEGYPNKKEPLIRFFFSSLLDVSSIYWSMLQYMGFDSLILKG